MEKKKITLNDEECKDLLFDIFKEGIGNIGEDIDFKACAETIDENLDSSVDAIEKAGL